MTNKTKRSGEEKTKPRKQAKKTAEKSEKRAASLRVIPLGGMNEIGKNMTVLEYGEDIIVVDAGSSFPDGELLGIDLVIPDMTWLQQNAARVKGIVITHAHEDHIGALPYLLREVPAPVFCTELTAAILELKLREHKNLGKVSINIRDAGSTFKLGAFDIEFIRVNHSVPDAVALAIKTPVGKVVMTGDFKIDSTPVDSEMINLERFGQLGREGVALLMCDSTNAERPGFSMSERAVGEALDLQFRGCDKRIIVSTFASNVHRVAQIISLAEKYGRKVVITGRSMENVVSVATEMGYIRVQSGTIVSIDNLKKLTPEKTVVITTGSQGEPLSGLYRMAFGGHRQVLIGPQDKVLLSSSAIPGNEKQIFAMINELYRKGAEVVYDKLAEIHASGHASREEIKIIMSLVKPKYFMPMHGEYRHLVKNAQLAASCGVDKNNIFIGELGRPLVITKRSAKWEGSVQSGRVLVDGSGVGDVGNVVLKERKHLSEDGLLICAVAVDPDGVLVAGPTVETKGFIYQPESEEIMTGMQRAAENAVFSCIKRNKIDKESLKSALVSVLSDFIYRKTKRNPMIITMIMDS